MISPLKSLKYSFTGGENVICFWVNTYIFLLSIISFCLVFLIGYSSGIINTVAFNVSAENLDDLFDKAFKILKAYVPKEPKVVQESVEKPKRMNVVDFKSKGDNNNGIF